MTLLKLFTSTIPYWGNYLTIQNLNSLVQAIPQVKYHWHDTWFEIKHNLHKYLEPIDNDYKARELSFRPFYDIPPPLLQTIINRYPNIPPKQAIIKTLQNLFQQPKNTLNTYYNQLRGPEPEYKMTGEWEDWYDYNPDDEDNYYEFWRYDEGREGEATTKVYHIWKNAIEDIDRSWKLLIDINLKALNVPTKFPKNSKEYFDYIFDKPMNQTANQISKHCYKNRNPDLTKITKIIQNYNFYTPLKIRYLNGYHRKEIHQLCDRLGYKTKSTGKRNRVLHIMTTNGSDP